MEEVHIYYTNELGGEHDTKSLLVRTGGFPVVKYADHAPRTAAERRHQ